MSTSHVSAELVRAKIKPWRTKHTVPSSSPGSQIRPIETFFLPEHCQASTRRRSTTPPLLLHDTVIDISNIFHDLPRYRPVRIARRGHGPHGFARNGELG